MFYSHKSYYNNFCTSSLANKTFLVPKQKSMLLKVKAKTKYLSETLVHPTVREVITRELIR